MKLPQDHAGQSYHGGRQRSTAQETTGITADTALRLGKALGTSAQLWMNLQNRYDVEIARREIGKKLDKIEPIIAHAAA